MVGQGVHLPHGWTGQGLQEDDQDQRIRHLRQGRDGEKCLEEQGREDEADADEDHHRRAGISVIRLAPAPWTISRPTMPITAVQMLESAPTSSLKAT